MIAATQPGLGRPRGDGWAVCEAHRDVIGGHLDRGVKLTKVGRLRRRSGVDVSNEALRRLALE